MKIRVWGIISAACVALLACTHSAEVVVTNEVRAVNGLLAESIGIETLGGALTPLLESGCKLPCETTKTFSTAEDNQTQIIVNAFQGNADQVANAKHLGKFQVGGIRPSPRGEPRIAISFVVEEGRLVFRANEDGVNGKLNWVKIE